MISEFLIIALLTPLILNEITLAMNNATPVCHPAVTMDLRLSEVKSAKKLQINVIDNYIPV